ncbi:hypothetical protein QZH56_16250 [Streptomyces olivoreticuli]|uniref:hypothetical protein n=1 Tax=Streptomyces olivoreticuli TaxID=68246 RepID=UPI00265AE223|nr:hypothetical protein [Streptomyces olivoreticuli]WKK27001.1 hypothetical protein QZH56_16250 [Streptomyces olivoreticuli]
MGYDGQVAAIHSAIAQLTALTGARPRVTEEPHAVLIEIDVTEPAARHWSSFVAILDLGTTFGLTDTQTGQVAWLRFESGEDARP